MKLDVIADLWNKGYKQREIGERVGLSQQVISYRIDVIKKKYPELLTAEPENFTKIQENSTKVCTNLQENSTKIQITHKNTKKQNFVQTCTNLYKDENFVQKNLENSSESEREQPSEEASKWAFEF
jgi:predicted transcriptional regulator